MAIPTAFARLRAGPELSRVQDQIATTVNPVAQAVASTPMMGAAPPAWVRPDLVGGYSQTAAPEAVVAYHKDALGYVHTKLSMTHTAGTAAGTVAFTYAAGYRPSETLPFMLSDAAGLAVAVAVNAAGQLSNVAVLGAASTLRGVFVFLAEQ